MSCTPNDNSINISASPGIPVPGLGIPLSPVQIPLPSINMPDLMIEDFVGLFMQLGALFPSGLFKPNFDFGMSNVLDFIANLLSQLAPFLSFYNFIMALLNLIICIIEVLCAIPNPFAIAIKLKKLFSECLPPFLNMFPWMALIAMILALLLLILSLITYIIETILAIISELIKNLILMVEAITLQDSTTALAIAQKIASLLCLIENILAFLLAIAAIMAVIQALMKFSGTAICSDEDGEGCCAPSICPPFIKNNNEIAVANGTLIYYKELGSDLTASGLPATLLALLSSQLKLREERWQLYDEANPPSIPIKSIIIPSISGVYGSQIFYPDQSFDADTPPSRAPYIVDMTLTLNPVIFGHADTGGSRAFKVNDCIVVRKPRTYAYDFDNQQIISTATSNGVFDIEGGLVFESDGITPFDVAGSQATLNTFIGGPPDVGVDLPGINDGYVISNVSFVWKPNHPALASHDLITVGCMPEVGLEKAVINAMINAEGTEAVLNKLRTAPDGDLVPSTGVLPNVVGTHECVQSAMATFRSNITLETTAEFQATIETCLNDLAYQTTAVFCGAFIAAVSQFKSTFSIDTDVQFTTRPIIISVILRDAGGTNIAVNLPDGCLSDILEKLQVEATLGTASVFTYDKANAQFNSNLISDIAGAGEISVLFENKVFSTLNVSTDFDTPSSITEDVLSYAFVDAMAEPAVRRDETDTARDGT